MASTVKDSKSVLTAQLTELQKLFECPVCVQIFRVPKLLPCGHSVCSDCCQQLNRDRVNLLCPVCRRPSSISAYNLPTNFGLQDLVQHHIESLESKKFMCALCQRRVSSDDCWSCQPCRCLICSMCAIKSHQNHNLKAIHEVLRDKEAELTEWRRSLTSVDTATCAARRQIEANYVRLLQGAQHLLYFTIGRKLAPQLEAESKIIKQDLMNLQNRYREVTAASLVADGSDNLSSGDFASLPCDFASLPCDFKTLAEKQQKLLKRQLDAIAAIRHCESALTALQTPPLAAGVGATANRSQAYASSLVPATGATRPAANATNASAIIPQSTANSNAQSMESTPTEPNAEDNSHELFMRLRRMRRAQEIRGLCGERGVPRSSETGRLFDSLTFFGGLNAVRSGGGLNAGPLSQSSDDEVRLDVDESYSHRPHFTDSIRNNGRSSFGSIEVRIDSDDDAQPPDQARRLLLDIVESCMQGDDDDDGDDRNIVAIGDGMAVASNDEMDAASNASIEAVNGEGSTTASVAATTSTGGRAFASTAAPPWRRPAISHKRCRGTGRIVSSSTRNLDGDTSAASVQSSDDDDDAPRRDGNAIGTTIRFRALRRP